jgi:hypothetical protein
MLTLPEGRRRSSLPVTPPNSPVSNPPATSKSTNVILKTSGTFLLISFCITLCGLLNVVPLKSSLNFSIPLTVVAFSLLNCAWLSGHLTFSASVIDGSTESALVCVAEVSIDADTQLTIRSWWPASLAVAEVQNNGTRVAMENAQNWLLANRTPLSQEVSFVPEFLHRVASETESETSCECSVCYDALTTGAAVRLRFCGHCVHAECLKEWFTTSGRATCPLCRCDHAALLPEAAKKIKQHNVRLLSVRVQRATLPEDVDALRSATTA